MNYRPEIDGLRAIAILPVILFHAGISLFSGGFVGVDVFFVISGYLITSIIYSELVLKKFSYSNFYLRRIRRILPALFFMVFVSIVLSFFALVPFQMVDFSESVFATAIGLSNFYFMSQINYFAGDAELQPLLHTWSLAIEEHYYLLFPFLLSLAYKKKLNILLLILILILFSFLISEVGRYYHSDRNFFITFSRFWELGVGSAIAIILSHQEIRKNNLFAVIGFIMIILPIFLYDHSAHFPSPLTLVPVLGTSFVILYSKTNTFLYRLLTTKTLVGIGLISYSLYLWHQPIFAFSKMVSIEILQTYQTLMLIPLIFLISFLSWKFIEQPFRNKQLVTDKTILGLTTVFLTLFIGFGVFFQGYFHKYEQFWTKLQPQNLNTNYFLVKNAETEISNYGTKLLGRKTWHDFEQCRFNTPQINEEVKTRILSCNEKHGPGILILGDSHGIDFYGVVSSRFNDNFIIGITKDSCRAHSIDEGCPYSDVLNFVNDNRGIFSKVLFETAGLYLLENRSGFFPVKDFRRIFTRLRLDEDVTGIVPNISNINKTLDYLESLSGFVEVVWFLPRAEPYINNKYVLRLGCTHNYEFRNNQLELFKELDKKIFIEHSKRKLRNLKLISQIELFEFNLREDYMSCSELYWSDGDHLSEEGEIYFGKKLPSTFLD